MNINHRFKLPQNSSSIHLRHKSSVSIKLRPLTSQEDCLFCSRKLKDSYYPKMIVKALYSKFASSQNYYYTRDINDILANNRTRAVIYQKDLLSYLEEDEEYLKRYYQINENPFKMKLLVEYYKFHKDIPRLFMQPTSEVLNRYHDKKRRIEYFKIKKMLKEQERQGGKSFVSDTNIHESCNSNLDSDKKNNGKFNVPIGNVLEGIDFDIKEENPQKNLVKLLNQQKKYCEVSNSYSLLELNKKLMDMTEMKSEFFIEEKNQKFHDLSNFLSYMKTNKVKKQTKNFDELSDIEKETTENGFCYINLPMKKIIKEEKNKINHNINKEIFIKTKKLDLSKLKKVEENPKKQEEIRPLSSNRKNILVNKGVNSWSKTIRDEIKSHRNYPSEKMGLTNRLFKINSERGDYEKTKKNFVEIANEAANKIINKSQSILKKENNKIMNSKQITNKANHTRVNSLYCPTNKNQSKINTKETGGSPFLMNPPSSISYNNFFKTNNGYKKETIEDSYNFNKNNMQKQNSLHKKPAERKISHKYTKSDSNLLLPKMIPGLNLNSRNNFNSQALFSIKESLEKGKKVEHSNKLSMNIRNEGENLKKNQLNQLGASNSNNKMKNNLQNSQYYTINQNNILNIYFGEEAKGIFLIFGFLLKKQFF